MLVVKQGNDNRHDGANVGARPDRATSRRHRGTQDNVRPLQDGNLRAQRDRRALVQSRLGSRIRRRQAGKP
eukprot:15449787-Alexandrium_andersonii.AAC.1